MFNLQTLSRPKHLGMVEPEVLKRIGERYPYRDERNSGLNEWYRKQPCKLDPTLEPILELILGSVRPKPNLVGFEVRNKLVGGTRGIISSWHCDGPFDFATSRIVVADGWPTEFLVAAPGLSWLEKIRQRRELGQMQHYASADSDALNANPNLAVWHPEPYEAVQFTDHIHRVPQLPPAQEVGRIWVRAHILSEEP